MLAFANTTNFDLYSRRTDVSCNNMAAGPSCEASPRSPQFDHQNSYDEDSEDSERFLAKKRECASRVAAWINQSAVRITAITSPYIPSTTSFDLLDFDLELDLEDERQSGTLNDRCTLEGEPYLFYSSSSKTVGAPVIHAPVPRRSSRSRGRRHHGHSRPRMPSPLYVIQEEDSE